MSMLCTRLRWMSASYTLVAVLDLALPLSGFYVLTTPASAQQPTTENPDALRPPTFLTYPMVSVQEIVVRLYFAELTHALRSGDTTTLSVLVPDSVIPAAEKLNARAKGCASLRAAVARLRARGAELGGLNSIALDEITVASAGQGDTAVFGAASLGTGARKSNLSVALTRAGHSRSMARVQGVLFGLCTMGA